jgi:hypothetical protein
MKMLSFIFLPILGAGSMLFCDLEAAAANKQGGGLFAAPKQKLKKKRKKLPVTSTVISTAPNQYDGKYSLNLNNTSRSTGTCLSGNRTIFILNGKTSGELFPFLATLGGTVRNGKIHIFKIKDGIADKANYTGQITLPNRPGETGAGQLIGRGVDTACVWRATITRF